MDLKVKTIENETQEDRMLNELLVYPIREKFVEIGKEKYVLPVYFCENWERVNKFEVRDDDVYIMGHPKTGTTWVHEIVDLIVNGVNSKDVNTSRFNRQLFLEFAVLFNPNIVGVELPHLVNAIDDLKDIQGPRCIRTHLPWLLIPEQIRNGTKSPKIIHVRRNPKDTCISFFHQSRAMEGYRGNFEQFCELFLAGRLCYGPYLTNVKSYWEQRHRSNIFFVNYADLSEDLPGTIKKMATFLDKSLSEKEVQDLIDFVSIDSMRKHVGKEMNEFMKTFTDLYNVCVAELDFIREGKEKGYKTVMSEELIKKFDKLEKEALEGTGLYF